MSSNNNLSTLNQVLFDQLNRLNTTELKGESLNEEIRRAYSIIRISKEVIDNARLCLDAATLKAEHQGLLTDDIAKLERLT